MCTYVSFEFETAMNALYCHSFMRAFSSINFRNALGMRTMVVWRFSFLSYRLQAALVSSLHFTSCNKNIELYTYKHISTVDVPFHVYFMVVDTKQIDDFCNVTLNF